MRTLIVAIEGYLSPALNLKLAMLMTAKQHFRESPLHPANRSKILPPAPRLDDGCLSSFPVVELGELLQQIAENALWRTEKKSSAAIHCKRNAKQRPLPGLRRT